MQGLDLETEMTNLISYQIGAEIDQQIKESMIFAAWNDSKIIDVSKFDDYVRSFPVIFDMDVLSVSYEKEEQ